ncbi:MAG: sulfotransferase domain-containing protein [Proteobacteria bacterium]|nr:sulfotransferase domain-containing protein [Pseudomonadota bacterium]
MRVLIACFPKSGSTFLASVIDSLPDFRIEKYVPDHQRREQELCDTAIGQCVGATQIAQLHVRDSWHTATLIEKWNIKTIVLARNIYDALVSLTDHMARESASFPHAWFNQDHAAMPFPQRLAAVVELAAPWFFNFYVSWWHGKKEAIVRYEDVILSGHLTSFLVEQGIAHSAADVAASLQQIDLTQTRLNVGKAGRGVELMTIQQRDWIANLTRHYPGVDFFAIGIPSR